MIRSFVRVYERDFTRLRALPTGLVFTPVSWSHAAIGGPKAATFTAEGPVQSLWALLSWLRSPVEIVSERGDVIWWGYAHDIEAALGAIRIGVSLDGLANNIAVQYEQLALNETTTGSSATTPYASNSDSIALFGTRELLAALTNATETIALAQRDRLLAALKNPIPTLSLDGGGRYMVTVRCRGWWDVLGWQQYSRGGAGTGSASLGLGSNYDYFMYHKCAMKFRLRATEGPFRARALDLQLSKDAAAVGVQNEWDWTLHADDAGGSQPGTQISGIATVDAGTVTPDGAWYKPWFAVPYPMLQGSTWYWLKSSYARDWTPDESKPFWMGNDGGGSDPYPEGSFWEDNGGWALVSNNIFGQFGVNGEMETTYLLGQMVTALAQGLLAGYVIETASGLYSSAYRPDNANGLDEALQLLDVGTSNGRRLLGRVREDRMVVFTEEPVSNSATDLRVNLSGALEEASGQPVEKALFRPGRWARLVMAERGEAELGILGPISPVFVEESEYTAARDELRVLTRDRLSVWGVGRVVR